MRLSNFRLRVENYYGMKYRAEQWAIVELYLRKIPPSMLDHLFAETVRSHPSQYKALPDVAVFDPLVSLLWESYDEGRIGAPTDAVQIEDKGTLPREEAAQKMSALVRDLAGAKRSRR